MSGQWCLDHVILWVQYENLCGARWLDPWLLSPVRWIWSVWWLIKEYLHEEGFLHGLWAALDSRVRWKGQESVLVNTWKILLFSPSITPSYLTMFGKGIFSTNSSVVTDRRTWLRAATEVCLTFKKKDVSWQLAKYHICLFLHLSGWSWRARWWRWANLPINCVKDAFSCFVQQL